MKTLNCKSFYPVIDKNSKILILGSIPGIKSLEQHQYYAHPQNRFWKIMGILCNYKNLHNLQYEEKIEILLKNKFALWDVINYCSRNGSLDSNIKNEMPNNINNLLNIYPAIKTIYFNGNKAFQEFKKHFPNLTEKYTCYKMPSTSPANARFNLYCLAKEWAKILI